MADQNKIRKYALRGAIIGGVIGALVTIASWVLACLGVVEIIGMVLLSMGFPAGVLVGAVVGIQLAEHTK